MKKKRRHLFILTIICTLSYSLVFPCTTFCFMHKGEWVFGRNYDWDVENCLIMVNKRNLKKVALIQGNPAQWVSKYGSITFNQYGRELPLGGINEAGLVIECMWLTHTEYPHTDNRPEVQELQWIQYQLDKSATVADVINSDKKIRISIYRPNPLHFLVCDRKGQAATIEFLAGKMTVHTGKTLPYPALTNNTYQYCASLLKVFKGDETSTPFKTASYSVKRFIWAAQGVKQWSDKSTASAVDYAFNILEKVAVNRTMIRVVYDVGNKKIYFRNKSNNNIRTIDFKSFDFSCQRPVKILDILSPLKGDVSKQFKDYSMEANLELIRQSFTSTPFLKNTPEEALRLMAAYPNSLICQEK